MLPARLVFRGTRGLGIDVRTAGRGQHGKTFSERTQPFGDRMRTLGENCNFPVVLGLGAVQPDVMKLVRHFVFKLLATSLRAEIEKDCRVR